MTLAEACVPFTQDNKELAARIEDVWNHYLAALRLWELKIKFNDYFWPKDKKFESILVYVPLLETIDLGSGDKNRFQFDDLIKRVWEAALPKLNGAKLMLENPTSSQQ